MATIKIDKLEDVQPGDRVTFKSDDVVVSGCVESYDKNHGWTIPTLSERVGGIWFGEKSGWFFVSAERDVPDLPTKPGLYIASSMADHPECANVLRLNGDEWIGDDERRARDWTRGGDTLVRLVPEGSEAKKIAEYLWELAAMPHRSPYATAVLKDAATDIERGDWNE